MTAVNAGIRAVLVLSGIGLAMLSLEGCSSQQRSVHPPIPQQNSNTDFATTRTFNAPPERIWQAWTEGEYLKQWWGPRGFACPVVDMDVRVGGTSLVAMQAPLEFGGATFYNTWTYTFIDPPRRMDFIVRFTDQHSRPHHPSDLGLPPGIPAEVPHILLFEPAEGGGTTLTVIEYGYESREANELSRQGLEQCLDKLAESLGQ